MSLIRNALLEERYDIVSEQSHPFETDELTGYTGVFVISESDATFHTYEEEGSIETTVNTCRGPDAGWITVASIVRGLQPKDGVYASSKMVPISSAERGDASVSGFEIDVGNAEEFLDAVDDRVEKCYAEMYDRFGDRPPA